MEPMVGIGELMVSRRAREGDVGAGRRMSWMARRMRRRAPTVVTPSSAKCSSVSW